MSYLQTNKIVDKFRIPYSSARSVEEYFSLPLSERNWHGFYKLPFALPSELFNKHEKGWDSFYAQIKKEYPLQYFLRSWLLSLDNPIWYFLQMFIIWPLRDLKYNIIRLLTPCFPRWRKVLPRHKSGDITWLVVESNFALICDFYWEEVVDGFVDWESSPDYSAFYEELKSNVAWIETKRKELDLTINSELQRVSETREDNKELTFAVRYEEVIRLEKIKVDKETEILKWFIDNRSYFWT